jgi:Domain of unknown function (DUF4129)
VRSPREPRPHAAVPIAIVAALLLLATVDAQRVREVQGHEGPQAAEIDRAVAKVKADPNLATEQTIKTLKWRSSSESKPFSFPDWLRWTVDLFQWIERSARALVWFAAAVLAGLLGVYISRIFRALDRRQAADAAFIAPTHVRDLDIRPETLPDDIGAAARALWDQGDHRAALALLYRGMLSRLAHVHHVPIRHSSTEGDCLALVAGSLAVARYEYAAGLIRVWQRSVYGRETVAAAAVHELCDGFAAALDAASVLAAAADGSAA